MSRLTIMTLLCIVTFTLFLFVPRLWSEGPDVPQSDLLLVPSTVPIGLFFHHGIVTVNGVLPAGCDAAMVVQSPNQEMVMNIRGKRLGLWMTVGTARFEDAPAFYQCLTSKPVEEIASPEATMENGLSFENIKEGMKLHVEQAERNGDDDDLAWKDEFVAFKEDSGLFSFKEGALTVSDNQGGTEKVQGKVLIPARSPEGDYRVVLVGLKEGAPVARIERTLSVTMMPTVAFLRDLAMEHGWVYGILAVVVALLAGFGVGAMMPSRGGAH